MLRVVPHRDQQRDGRVRPDTHHSEQLRGVAFHKPGQAAFQALDLLGGLPDPLGRLSSGSPRRIRSVDTVCDGAVVLGA